MADLPFILAGPILRRVEPRLVTVWMALSEPRALQLNVFEGRQQTGTGKFVFLGGPIVRGAANTLSQRRRATSCSCRPSSRRASTATRSRRSFSCAMS